MPLQTGDAKRNRLSIQVPLTSAPISITFFGVWGFDGDEISIHHSIRHPPQPPRDAANERGGRPEPSASSVKNLLIPCEQLLAAQNCVFGCLGDAELDHPFCSNLDGLAGCRISTHASFAIHQNNLAQSRNRERVLRIFIRECHQSFQGLHGLFLCQANGFRK